MHVRRPKKSALKSTLPCLSTGMSATFMPAKQASRVIGLEWYTMRSVGIIRSDHDHVYREINSLMLIPILWVVRPIWGIEVKWPQFKKSASLNTFSWLSTKGLYMQNIHAFICNTQRWTCIYVHIQPSGSKAVAQNCSPAPSQSAPVMRGVCVYTKPRSLKNL